jgi:hypothetical protein
VGAVVRANYLLNQSPFANADTVDGYHATTSATSGQIPVLPLAEARVTFATAGHAHNGTDSSRITAVSCKVYHSQALISVPSGTYTPLEWDSEAFDVNGMHESVTHPSYITVPVAGKYQVILRTSWSYSVANPNDRYQYIKKNNTTSYGLCGGVAASSGSNGAIILSITNLNLAANDFLESYVYQNTGAALNTVGGDEYSSTFEVTFLGT